MAPVFDCSVKAELLSGVRLTRAVIERGELAVIPTDTVYGIAADAFSPAAVQRLLDAKGRGRSSPPPVLIPAIETLDALADSVPDAVRDLVAAFWPGGLTIILPARSSLNWDLGDALSVYLDDGAVGAEHSGAPDPGSTIVDATGLLVEGGLVRIVRHGVISDEAIREVVGADRCE
jgi:L-threonylcarbamoyladenylate synthase